MKRLWSEEQVTFEGKHARAEQAWCEPKPVRRPPILIGGGGERKLLRIVAKHADIWNNLAVNQAQLGDKIEVLRRRCDEAKRDPASIEISQQCLVVIAADDAGAREALAKASRIYGGHMGGGLEEHGIWGTPGAGDRAHRTPSRARLHALRHGVLRARHPRAGAAVRGTRAAGVRLSRRALLPGAPAR